MKCIILAGGKGTRLGKISKSIPKPMIEIGNKPIIWHIMKMYEYHKINKFIICLGYKGFKIKEYFLNYSFINSDLKINLQNNKVLVLDKNRESFEITFCETGEETGTAGRIKMAAKYVDDENFCLTYGDGLSDINISKLVNLHLKSRKLVTLTAVQPKSRFGNLKIKKNILTSFYEKGLDSWINGGFFVINKKVLKFINKKSEMWEKEPINRILANKQVNVYKHLGFWQCVDHERELIDLNIQWKKKPKWKLWKG